MNIVVLKFGGTSVGTIKKIKKVTEIIAEFKKKGYKLIVISSAMSGVTNDLIKKSKEISKNFSESESDVLLSSGEQVACSLIAGCLLEKKNKFKIMVSMANSYLYKRTLSKFKNPKYIKKKIT